MSVSTKPKAAAEAAGETVSNRHYVARFRCPTCQKRYAKRTLWVKHIKGCGRWPTLGDGVPYYGTPLRLSYDWVSDNVATGGGIWTREDLDRLVDDGITHIVTAADELIARVARLVEDDPRVRWLPNGLPDDYARKPAWWFAKTIDFAKPALDAGGRVYLHCYEGVNRGPSHAYALMRATGMSGTEAEMRIRSARPKVHLKYMEDADDALLRIGA
jgi:hypothetical protein